MAKTLTFEFPEAGSAELEQLLAQMQRANVQMQRDQKEIEDIKAETSVVAERTREVLIQLEVATA